MGTLLTLCLDGPTATLNSASRSCPRNFDSVCTSTGFRLPISERGVTRHRSIRKILTSGDFRRMGPRFGRNRHKTSFARATCTLSWTKKDVAI